MGIRMNQFFCTKCGNRGFDIPRKENRQRPSGHLMKLNKCNNWDLYQLEMKIIVLISLKKLYCIHCHEDTNHVEVRDLGKYTYRDFLCEFNNGNFDSEGNRVTTNWKGFVDNMKKEGKY